MPHMREDWTAGVLESLIDDDLNSETATGVQFLRADVDDYLATTVTNPEHPSADRSVETTAKTGGRRLSTDWFEWVAEAVATVHELGVPDGHGSEGQAELLRRVEDGLARRGLEGPSRTTVQPAVNAILRRLREGPKEDRDAAEKPSSGTGRQKA